MHAIVIAAAAFSALVSANSQANAFNNPPGGYVFTAGKPTTLSWDPTTTGSVSLRLQSGSVSTAEDGIAIASSIGNSGSYTWHVPTDLVADQKYTLEIIDDSDANEYNFSPSFTVGGATGSASTSSAAASTSSEAATTSSEATTTSTSTSSTSTSSTSSTSATPSSTTTSESSSSATTMSTMTSASASTSMTASSSAGASSTADSSSSAASSSASASSTSVPNNNAGVANGVPAGMMALFAGLLAFL